MTTTLTPKENYLRLAKGSCRKVCRFLTWGCRCGWEMTTAMIGPSIFMPTHMGPEGGKDPWGCIYVANEETGYAAIPEPNNFLLEDVTSGMKLLSGRNCRKELTGKTWPKKITKTRKLTAQKLPSWQDACLCPSSS